MKRAAKQSSIITIGKITTLISFTRNDNAAQIVFYHGFCYNFVHGRNKDRRQDKNNIPPANTVKFKPVEVVEKTIAPEVIGMDSLDQKALDAKLLSLDTTERKENLGGNTMLSVSLATARAALAKVSRLVLSDEATKCAKQGNVKELEKVVEKTFKTI